MFENKKTIMKLYNEYISQNNNPTKKYIELKKEFEKTVKELTEGVTENEKTKIERICECLLEMGKEQETNAFVEGYTLGTNLTTEAIYRGMK